jgi:hypothetical protein
MPESPRLLVNQVSKLFNKSPKEAQELCGAIAVALGVEGVYLSSNSSAAVRAVRAVFRRPDFKTAVLSGQSFTGLIELSKPAERLYKGRSVILEPSTVKITRVGLGKGAHSVIYSN